MTTHELLLSLALLLAGVVGTAICSGVETGIYSLSRVKLNLRALPSAAADDPWQGRLARILRAEVVRPARTLATLLITSTFFSNLGSIGMSKLLEARFSEASVVVLNVLILTPLLFVLADALPKELFRIEADRLTYLAAPFLWVARLLLTVTLVLPVIEWLVRFILRRFGLQEESLDAPEHAIAALLKEGARHGVLSESQTTLLDRALLLRDTKIRGEMVPWSQAHMVSTEWDRPRVAEFLANHQQSRYPVVDPLGTVVGVVEHLDMCVYPDKTPVQLAHPVVFLDPEASVRDGLVKLRAAEARLGVVRQGGRPVGVVSTADLIEPLTGSSAA